MFAFAITVWCEKRGALIGFLAWDASFFSTFFCRGVAGGGEGVNGGVGGG
jgi:hypothetical protein